MASSELLQAAKDGRQRVIAAEWGVADSRVWQAVRYGKQQGTAGSGLW